MIQICFLLEEKMSRRYSTEDFIAKAKAAYGNKCDYSRVIYIDSVTHISI